MGFRGSRVQIPPSRLKRRATWLAVFRRAGGLLPPPLAVGSRHSRSNPAVPTRVRKCESAVYAASHFYWSGAVPPSADLREKRRQLSKPSTDRLMESIEVSSLHEHEPVVSAHVTEELQLWKEL